jgi:hypothetical protein
MCNVRALRTFVGEILLWDLHDSSSVRISLSAVLTEPYKTKRACGCVISMDLPNNSDSDPTNGSQVGAHFDPSLVGFNPGLSTALQSSVPRPRTPTGFSQYDELSLIEEDGRTYHGYHAGGKLDCK